MRTVLFTLGILLFGALCVCAAPDSMTYQGRLTDPGGNPVPDGNYSLTLRIYSTAIGGVALYTSGPTSVPVSNGLFVTIMSGISESVFLGDTRYLGITVGADPEISPRTALTTSPYAFRVETIDSATGGTILGSLAFNNGSSVYARANQAQNSLGTYNSIGNEVSRLWGPSWGQLLLYQNDGSQIVDLNANGSGGGSLRIRDGSGTTTVLLNAGSTGNNSVILPNDGVSAAEMLDEPGIASRFAVLSPVINGSGIQAVDSLTIVAPASGYVVITVSGHIETNHVTGTNSVDRVYASSGSLVADFDNLGIVSVPSATANGVYYSNYSISYVDQVTAGNQKYYLGADEFTGTGDFRIRYRMIAEYFPTAYGTVVETAPPLSGGTTNASATGTNSWLPQIHTITLEEHNAAVAVEVAKARAELEAQFEARLQNLEHQQVTRTQGRDNRGPK